MSKIINERYEVLQSIGTGGMADVFLCFDLVLKRDVALKRLRGDLSDDPVALLRFQREANAASGLHHPNIVEVYDVGDDQGQPYIVMEFVKGITAKELVHRRGALEKYEALSIMKQLVSAVKCAHEAGIVHRDIKPQNILVKDDGTVKIADFGIALANDALQLTKVDSVMGSVHYLAPECVRGDGATIQSDIYAMGIVFFELITGALPYRGETSVEVAMKHLKDPMPSVLKYNSEIPHSFANIITKACQKNKIYRYRLAQDMFEDLSTSLDPQRIHEALWLPNIIDDEETKMITALNGIDDEDIDDDVIKEPWSRKKKIQVSIATVLIAAIVVTLGIIFWPKPPAPYYLEDLVGVHIDDARAQLAEHNIYINDSLSYDYSEEFDKGYIIATRPVSGTQIEPGSQIRVTVSQGRLFEIPDFAGKTRAQVQEILANYPNITIQTRTVSDSTVEPGIIVGQEGLSVGQMINPSQKYILTLLISSEPEIIMQDFRGKPIEEAQKTLEDLGIVVKLNRLSMAGMSEERVNSLQFGVVIDQNPFAGSYYVQLENSSVTLSFYDVADKPTFNTNSNDNSDDTDNTN
ncbi:hypothetical protein AOC36_05415 [Erysipelothrix larvae]|uniref:non-specific serine/threonine protein kinase n=1 Tax=Erysipelothrix larvae TaxID=1514105 RepID=A0A109UGY1_9FIRM|nr:Stk1 family PASTA domain-containing Ser/Thr kinase [Erysipelothrix larvae]AMC93437.1 hypothetical protein AOC36_05415 [Erysipelothrix larvae]